MWQPECVFDETKNETIEKFSLFLISAHRFSSSLSLCTIVGSEFWKQLCSEHGIRPGEEKTKARKYDRYDNMTVTLRYLLARELDNMTVTTTLRTLHCSVRKGFEI
jgi:hypothetical protein